LVFAGCVLAFIFWNKVVVGTGCFLLVFLAYCAWVFYRQESFLYATVVYGYQYTHQNPKGLRHPGEARLPFRNVYFKSMDGTELHGWLVQAPGELWESAPTVFFLHGNAGNIGLRIPNIVDIHFTLRANVFIFDYRGYGDSEGTPSEPGLVMDAEAALKWLIREGGVHNERIFVFGRSLGGAVAVQLLHLAESAAKKEAIPKRDLTKFSVKLTRTDQASRVGMKFTNETADDDHLVVTGIEADSGLLRAWNETSQNPVQVGDWICAVNGKKVAKDMRNELQKSPDLEIEIQPKDDVDLTKMRGWTPETIPKVAGLILENTFTSAEDVFDSMFPFLRVGALKRRLFRLQWETKKFIGDLRVPILFLAGAADEIVPHRQMLQLRDLVGKERSSLEVFDYGTHAETYKVGISYWNALTAFLSAPPSYSDPLVPGSSKKD